MHTYRSCLRISTMLQPLLRLARSQPPSPKSSPVPGGLRSRLAGRLRDLARLALAGLIFSLPFRLRLLRFERPFPPIYGDFTDVLLFISDALHLALLAFWLLSLALEPRRVRLEPLFLTVPVFLLTGASLLSAFTSVDPLLSLYHAVRLLLLGGLYLYVLDEVQELRSLALPAAGQALLQAAVGIAQVLRQRSLGLDLLGELELDPAWSGVSIVWAEGVRSLRAYGLADHPNLLGGCLAFALLLVAAWHAQERGLRRTVLAGVFSLGALGLFLTYSRSAWLAFAGASLLAMGLLLWGRQFERLGAWLALLGAAAIVVLPFLWANASYVGVRLNWQASFQQVPAERQALGERALLNRAAAQIFTANALDGIGLGAFPLALQRRVPDLPVDYQPAHFVLLDIAAETGIFGALFYVLAATAPWLALLLNPRRLLRSPRLGGATALLFAVTLVGFFDYYTWLLQPGRLWHWLAWGFWGKAYLSSRREAEDA